MNLKTKPFHNCDCACACAAPQALPSRVDEASPEERQLLQQQFEFGQALLPSSRRLASMGDEALNDVIDVDYNGLWNRAQQGINRQQGVMEGIQSDYTNRSNELRSREDDMYNRVGEQDQLLARYQQEYEGIRPDIADYQSRARSLANGEVPQAYMDNRIAAMSGGIEKMLGKNMNQMYKKGLVGGTDIRNMQDSMNQTVAQQMSAGFNQDISQQNQLLGNFMTGINAKERAAESNRTAAGMANAANAQRGQSITTAQNNLDARSSALGQLSAAAETQAMTPMQSAATAQQASLNAPMQFFGAAIGNQQPSNALYGTLSDQRYSLAAPNQYYTPPTVTGCVPSGTMINTPDGFVLIEKIQTGDIVLSLFDEQSTVLDVMEPHVAKVYLVETNHGDIICTDTQPFFDKDFVEKDIRELKLGDVIIHNDGMAKITNIQYEGEEWVHDITTDTGDYLANGFLLSDWGEING